VRVGYHASHEQFSPSELLSLVRQAEAAGFRDAMCSDHLAPFSCRQGESGFAWSWLGAALASTGMTFGTVNAPGQRYHPAIIAQAIATLSQMFEGRFWVALGTGQFINEQVTGSGWPSKQLRTERLLECVQIIRALLDGETVEHHGEVVVSGGRLYTLPTVQPLLLGAAITPETAAWAATWADGLITVYQHGGRMQEVVESFRSAGGTNKPIFLQAQHAFAPTYEQALEGATREWAHSVLSSPVLTDLRYPEQVDDASALAKPADVSVRVRISAEPEEHLGWLREYGTLGFDAVYVHNVTRYQREFIDAFGRHVLPHFNP
jgi:coenzyme F420-dependent glucose-6-phosphate dehydrogenase